MKRQTFTAAVIILLASPGFLGCKKESAKELNNIAGNTLVGTTWTTKYPDISYVYKAYIFLRSQRIRFPISKNLH